MPAIATTTARAQGRSAAVMRWTARGILIAITCFWIWFGIADGLGDAQTLGLMGFIMMLPAALITLAVLYVAWRWELIGGLVLLAVTALGLVLYLENMQQLNQRGAARLGEAMLGLSIFVLPFIIPSALLLAAYFLDRRARRKFTPAAT